MTDERKPQMAAWHGLLEELVRDRRPALIGYASLLTGNRSDAEDLVHEAIVRTFARTRSFENVNAADAYIRRAITSTFIDRARSRRSWLAAAPKLVVHDDSRPEEDVASRVDVRAALVTLPPRQRSCVVLRFYDDLTVPEIANALGLSDGAVKRYLSDGIKHLNGALGTHVDAEAVADPRSEIHVTEGRGHR